MTDDAGRGAGRTTVRRHRERGEYDREVVEAILDEGMICHLAACGDGQPWMLPTAYGRDGEKLYLHGAAANHLLKVSAGTEVVVCVSLLDGLVLARSTFNHSLNYRSVVVFGTAEEVTEPAEKAHGLEVIVDHLLPGRTREARPPTEIELLQTRVLQVRLDEASAKVRTGPPADDEADVALPVWAGVIPLRTVAGQPEADEHTPAGMPLPAGVDQPGRWATA